MTVSTIASLAAGIQRTLDSQNASVASSVKNIISSAPVTPDAAPLNVSTGLQTQIASLRSATQTVAQASAQVGVAQGATSEISRVLGRLQDLSLQASNASLSSSERAALDAEFQSLRGDINNIANNTSFGGQPLQIGGDSSGALASLTDEALFSGANAEANLLSANNAQAAATVVGHALDVASQQQASLGDLGQGLDFAFASLQSAAQNQAAAGATLSEADFTASASDTQQAQVQQQATTALLAQTSKLPGNILALLAE